METIVGIDRFLSEGVPFRFLFKHRFADFIVQEIDLQGRVAQVQDRTLWKEAANPTTKAKHQQRALAFEHFDLSNEFLQQSTERFGTEVTEQFKALVSKVKATGKCVQFETKVALPDSKEDRIKVHQLIRENIPFLESFTKNVHNQKSKKEIKDDKLQGDIPNTDHILIKTSNINFKKFVAKHSSSSNYGETKKYVKFILMKKNLDSINAGMFISKQLGLSNKHFAIAGTKDKRGITTQWATLQGMEICQLSEIQERQYWNNNILMTDFSYEDQGLKLGDLQGNKFIITLRLVDPLPETQQVELLNNIENLKTKGFVNYFGLQRFGSKHKIKTHQIGKELVKQHWREVIRLILLSSMEEEQEKVNQLFNQDDFEILLTMISPRLRIERQIVENLLKQGVHNYYTVLQSLPRNARELYIHAYQSYLWNKMASARLQKHGSQIVLGDIVCGDVVEEPVAEEAEEIEVEEAPQSNIPICTLVTNENIHSLRFDQVVLPIYGPKITIPDSIAKSLLEEIFAEEQITPQEFEEVSDKFFIDGNFRYLVQVPTEFQHQLFKYNNRDQDVVNPFGELSTEGDKYEGLLISFKLKKSSYATMLIRELTKSPSTLEFQQELSEQFH